MTDFTAKESIRLLKQITTMMEELPPELGADAFFEAFSKYMVKYAPDAALVRFAEEAAVELTQRKKNLEEQQRLKAAT